MIIVTSMAPCSRCTIDLMFFPYQWTGRNTILQCSTACNMPGAKFQIITEKNPCCSYWIQSNACSIGAYAWDIASDNFIGHVLGNQFNACRSICPSVHVIQQAPCFSCLCFLCSSSSVSIGQYSSGYLASLVFFCAQVASLVLIVFHHKQ